MPGFKGDSAIMILFIHPGFSNFVKKDYQILTKHFKIKKFCYKTSKKLTINLQSQIKMFIWLLKNIWLAKFIYIWFADYHSFLPVLFGKIFKKKSIIIVGGYDAVSIPELEFGVFYKKFRSSFAKFSYKNANIIIPVDESLIKSVNYYINKRGLKIGIKNFITNIITEIKTIPTGYDPKIWYKKDNIKKERIVLSIGGVSTLQTYRRKGFDFLIDIARRMPKIKFILAGLKNNMYEYAKEIITDNVELHKFIPNNELINFYSKAKVFCQLSLSEGLPNTLCEAMLCECIPVGSNVNGIPRAIGNCGFVLKERNVDKAIKLIEKAMNSPESLGKKARERIMKNFTLEQRENKIISIIKRKDYS